MVYLDDLPQELWIKVAVKVEHDSHLVHWLSVDPFSSARHMHDAAFELLFRDSCITFLVTDASGFVKKLQRLTGDASRARIVKSLTISTIKKDHITDEETRMNIETFGDAIVNAMPMLPRLQSFWSRVREGYTVYLPSKVLVCLLKNCALQRIRVDNLYVSGELGEELIVTPTVKQLVLKNVKFSPDNKVGLKIDPGSNLQHLAFRAVAEGNYLPLTPSIDVDYTSARLAQLHVSRLDFQQIPQLLSPKGPMHLLTNLSLGHVRCNEALDFRSLDQLKYLSLIDLTDLRPHRSSNSCMRGPSSLRELHIERLRCSDYNTSFLTELELSSLTCFRSLRQELSPSDLETLFNYTGPSLQLETLELSHVTPIQETMNSLKESTLFPCLTTLIFELQCINLTNLGGQMDSLACFISQHSQSLTSLIIEPDFYNRETPDNEVSRKAFDALAAPSLIEALSNAKLVSSLTLPVWNFDPGALVFALTMPNLEELTLSVQAREEDRDGTKGQKDEPDLLWEMAAYRSLRKLTINGSDYFYDLDSSKLEVFTIHLAHTMRKLSECTLADKCDIFRDPDTGLVKRLVYEDYSWVKPRFCTCSTCSM
ncbi:hypothetical protein C8J56DRAFT_963384 [Mycena floridula]|nr:hypothetical protein C8J56DRAFT_963384 [Mycena floridula]